MNKKLLSAGILSVAGLLLTSGVCLAAVSFSQANPVVTIGSPLAITISGGTDFYVSSNSNSGIMTYTLNGQTMTITGLLSGSAVVNVCALDSTCADLNVTIGSGGSSTTTTTTPTPGISFSAANPTLAVSQSVNITLSGSTSYFVSTNSNSDVIQAGVSGSLLMLTGLKAGSASLTVCGNTNGCNNLTVTVTNSTGTVTPTTPVVTTTATVSASNNTSVLAEIQSMRSQLAQLLISIQAIESRLTQLAASLPAATSATASTGSSAATQSFTGAFSSFLQLNSSGAEVTALQKVLIKEGFLSGSATGYFGSKTEEAVKKYQESHGLTAAGYVGPSTRAILNSQ